MLDGGASRSLRLAVKCSLETVDQFQLPINHATEAEEEGEVGAGAGAMTDTRTL